ncbi:hypothetical protein pb186bvf_010967 [Paramecium bursaria]
MAQLKQQSIFEINAEMAISQIFHNQELNMLQEQKLLIQLTVLKTDNMTLPHVYSSSFYIPFRFSGIFGIDSLGLSQEKMLLNSSQSGYFQIL